MKIFILFLYAFFHYSVTVAQTGNIAIKNVTVVDVKNGSLLANKTVILNGNRIQAIQNSKELPSNIKLVEGEGKFLIPGMWDMHMHALQVKEVRDLYLAHGVTGLRENGGSLDLINLLDSLKSSETRLPRHEVGIMVNNFKLYPSTVKATTPMEAIDAVDSLHAGGAHFIKAYSGLTPEVFKALIERSNQLNLPVAGHLPDLVRPTTAADLGMKSMEHVSYILKDCTPLAENEEHQKKYWQIQNKTDLEELRTFLFPILKEELSTFDPNIARKIAKSLAANSTAVTPTLVTMYKHWYRPHEKYHEDEELEYIPAGLAESWHFKNQPYTVEQWEIGRSQHPLNQKLVKILNQEGVLLLAGSDMGVAYIYPGYSLHEELEFLVEAGLSTLEALQTATLNPAIYFNRENELGTVEEGKLADLVLLNSNPLEDISNTLDIEAVWINGNHLDKEELDRLKENAKVAIQNMTPPEDGD